MHGHFVRVKVRSRQYSLWGSMSRKFRHCHRYSKRLSISAAAKHARRTINATEDVFASVDASSENECLDSCGDDEIVSQTDG